jgi:hypothetical protein
MYDAIVLPVTGEDNSFTHVACESDVHCAALAYSCGNRAVSQRIKRAQTAVAYALHAELIAAVLGPALHATAQSAHTIAIEDTHRVLPIRPSVRATLSRTSQSRVPRVVGNRIGRYVRLLHSEIARRRQSAQCRLLWIRRRAQP